MNIREEALRYLGYRDKPDEQTEKLLSDAEKALSGAVKPSFCWRVFEKTQCEHILIGEDIKKHLADSEKIILFAATLGVNADRLIRAAEIENMAYAVVMDSCASAMIEAYCDECEAEMKLKTGGSFTQRYSPGYGDYPISLQSEFIRILSADKQIGLTATENHILIPRKSVTAVIGITDKKRDENRNKCDSCNMREKCGLRKAGQGCEC